MQRFDHPTEKVTFITAVNDERVFKSNFLSSPLFKTPHPHQFLMMQGYDSATKAYNDAILKAENDLLIFAHQDMVLPREWLADVESALGRLMKTDPDWGVLGCWGATQNGNRIGYLYCNGNKKLFGERFEAPREIQTLDEIILITRKSSGLRFDAALGYFHFYGTDLCLQARKQKKKCYVISALCLHNTNEIVMLPKEFYKAYHHIKRVWKDFLPIHTTCTVVCKGVFNHYKCRLKAFIRYYMFLRTYSKRLRVSNPLELLEIIESRAHHGARSPNP